MTLAAERATSMQQPVTRLVPGHDGHVLILSMRRLATLVAFCILYEFEDSIVDLTGADCVEVGDQQALNFSRRIYKFARMASRSPRVARAVAPKAATIALQRDYELFLPILNSTHDLYALASVPDWRSRCRYAACIVNEVWAHLLPEYLLELLSQFDHIFLGTRHCVDDVQRIVGKPCSYLPPGADVLRFSPWPVPPVRSIDVLNIGRRSEITHRALIELAAAREFSYFYDTIEQPGFGAQQRTFHVSDPREHRLLLAQTLQRSRYYITHRARINQPDYTANREEIGGRFYEGVASGAILIGQAPRTAEFQRQFDWPDAVIPVPFDCPDIGRVLTELDDDPERLAVARGRNVHFAARRHDWLYRLQTVFDTFGIRPTPAMQVREQTLAAISDIALRETSPGDASHLR
jgi:hypothetical protein